MNSKIIGGFAAVTLLAACSSSVPPDVGPRRTGTGGTSGFPSAAREDPLTAGADKVFFDLDRAVIRDDARATLDQQADWLSRNKGLNVLIAGNCDERGTTEYNLALGSRRAYAAYTYLLAKGVPANRMTTISFGKDKPTATGSTEDSWAKNRNAITSVL